MRRRSGKFVSAVIAVLLLMCAGAGTASAAVQLDSPVGPPVTIPGSGIGDPYPSVIDVEGGAGGIDKFSVSVSLDHEFVSDLDMMVVSPGGTAIILMSDACAGQEVTGLNLTFQSGAPQALPNTATCTSGTYRPTNFDSGVDTYPAPSPGSTSISLDYFLGGDPNGAWKLFVVDDSSGDPGVVNSWSISMETDAGEILIPGSGTSGVAAPYPSTKSAPTPPGQVISSLRLDITHITHRNPEDVDILLANDKGDAVVVASDACGQEDLPFATWSFADANTEFLGEAGGCYSVRDVSQIDYGATPDVWPAPAPSPSGGNFSDVFGGQEGGDWNLYVVDDADGTTGFITSWNIALETRPANGVGFASTAESAGEGGRATVKIGRDGPTPRGNASVEVGVTSGSAKPGQDFLFPRRTLRLARLLLLAELGVPIIDDGTAEKAETFRIALSDPKGDAALSEATRTVTVKIPASKNATLKLGWLKLNRKKGTGTLVAKTSSPGKVIIAGRGLKKTSRKLKKAGTVVLPVRAVGKWKRGLTGTGKVELKARVTYRTLGTHTVKRVRNVTLRKSR